MKTKSTQELIEEFKSEWHKAGIPNGAMMTMVNFFEDALSSIASEARKEERGRIRVEFAIMNEPTPSANDHSEYNRGVRTGVELCRNHLLQSISEPLKEE